MNLKRLTPDSSIAINPHRKRLRATGIFFGVTLQVSVGLLSLRIASAQPLLTPTLDAQNDTLNVLPTSPNHEASLKDINNSARMIVTNNTLIPAVSLRDMRVTAEKPETANISFTIVLSAPSTNMVAVTYAISGHINKRETGLFETGTVIFNSGEATKTIASTVNKLIRPDNDVLVNITSVTNASIAVDQVRGTKIRDDSPPDFSLLSSSGREDGVKIDWQNNVGCYGFFCRAAEIANSPMPPPSSVTRNVPEPPRRAETSIAPQNGLEIEGNARVNVNPVTLTRPQVEPSIASKPTNRFQLVAGFADSLNDPNAFDFAPGIMRSTDGGKIWSVPIQGPKLPNPPGFIWGSRTLATHLASGDSAVAWGLSNTIYFSTLGFHDNQTPPNNNCSGGGLYVYRSDDGGNIWTLPANGPAIPNTQTIFRDKEYIAVDSNPASPFAGRVYMVWDDDNYAGCPQNFPTNLITRNISFSFSADNGATWSAPSVLASGCLVAPIPAVGINGDLYVVWFDCNVGNRQLVRKSTTGGASFGAAIAAVSGLTLPPNPLIGSNFRVNASPAIATDPTDASLVYVTWSSNNGASQSDVFVSRSLNGGATWDTPVRVNDDPAGNPRDQFFPWIAVDSDSTVRVMWGDDRLDLINTGGKLYDIFMAESFDHGTSFGVNVQVTTESSNPDFDGFNGTFIGDYFGLAANGVAVWGDTRTGNQDIFGAVLGPSGNLVNISTRDRVLTGDNVMIGGFIIHGSVPKRVLIRSRGPSLGGAPFFVPGVLANPFLRIFSGQMMIAQNDNWQDAASCSGFTCESSAAIVNTGLDPCEPNPGQPALPPQCTLESAILITLSPGAYTAIVTGADGGTGVGLVEVFDADATPLSELSNISTRGFVQTGDNVMIGGTIIEGSAPATVLIRARGPSMSGAPLFVPGTMANPFLQLFSGQNVIAQNDNWQDAPNCPGFSCGGAVQIAATGLDPCQPNPDQSASPPGCIAESAILITVPPGAYTAIVSGVTGGIGVGLVEVFEIN